MNIREDSTIRAPSGKDDICAKFTIDTVDEPFVMHDITEAGSEYTFSFWCYSETDGEITVGGLYMTTSSSWTRYVVTFISDSVDVPIYFNIPGTYHIYNAQLEIGCKDTDFALNPADTEEDVAALSVVVNSHSTQFTVMDGKIAGLIEENTTIRGEHDALVDRTADLELSLDEYKVTVSETYSTKAEFETVDGKVTTLEEWQVEASQQITKEGIIATVGNYYAYQTDLEGVADRVEAAESQIIQHADEISLMVREEDVTGDYLIGKINLTSSTASIDASHINLTGYVTISSLAAEGETDINGANITTGLISADRIDVDDLFSKSITATNLHITGSSTFDGVLNGATGVFSGVINATGGNFGCMSILDDTIVCSNTNNAYYPNASMQLSPWLILLEDGNDSLSIEPTYLLIDQAEPVSGDIVIRLDSANDTPLYIGKHNGSTGYEVAFSVSSAGRVYSNAGYACGNGIYRQGSIELYGSTPFVDFHTGSSADDFVSRIIDCGDSSAGHLRLISDRVTITGNGYAVTMGKGFTSGNTTFMPVKSQNSQPTAADGVVYNGASSSRWLTMYAKNGVNTTSDERDKNIIGEIDQRYLDAFMDFKAVLYRWKDDDLGKVHMGLVAQSTEQTLLEHGISMDEFAALEHDYWDAPNEEGRIDRYGLNYSELLTVMVPVVQMQESAIADHEYRLDIVENHQESMDDQLSAAFERISELESQLSEAKNEIEQLKQQASAA